jgi:hypothetical protein
VATGGDYHGPGGQGGAVLELDAHGPVLGRDRHPDGSMGDQGDAGLPARHQEGGDQEAVVDLVVTGNVDTTP